MPKLYRLTWKFPGKRKKYANWWTPSKEVATKDQNKIEEEYGVTCELEEKDV